MAHFATIKSTSLNCKSESGSDEFSPHSIKGGTGIRKKIFVSFLALSLLLAGLSWHTDVHKKNSLVSRSLMNIFDRNSPSENTLVSANRKKKDKVKTTKTPKTTKPPTIKTTKAPSIPTTKVPTIKTTKAPTAKKNKRIGKSRAPRASVTYTVSNAVSSLTSLMKDSRASNGDGYNSSGSTGTARAKGKGSYSSDCVDEDDYYSKGSTGKGGKGKSGKGKSGKGKGSDYSLGKGGKGKGSDYSLGKGGKGGKGKGNKSRRLKSGSSKDYSKGKGSSYSKGKGSSYSKGSGKGGSKGSKGSSKGSTNSKGGKGKGGCYYNNDQPSTIVVTTPSPTPANIVTTATPTGSTGRGCTTWSLVADIDGENIGDYAAGVQGVKLSGDGLVVAIGSRFADSTGNITDSGAVSVYEVINGDWIMRGSPIYGIAAMDLFGHSVDMSFDGNILAVGSPYADSNAGADTGSTKIFDWNGSTWVERTAIGGPVAGDLFGLGVSMNDAGDRIAIGATMGDGSVQDTGYVVVFQWDGSTWNTFGSILFGVDTGDEFGYALDMDSSGDTIIVGAQGDLARVFMYDGVDWVQKGSDLMGGSDGQGHSVAINGNGNVVIVGSPNMNAGDATIFEYNGSDWVQKGNTIVGSFADDGFGASVSINVNGDIVAIGAPFNDNVGDMGGQVTIYAYDSTTMTWGTIIGPTGEYYGDMAGSSVSLNSDGNCVAVGAEGHDDYYGDFDWDNGQVRILCCLGR